mmetsp:Transcript_6337/g.10456  ORF Transcript_6337/g.10456 Transcript_6337/m.10456 type:complete len:271 (+) Transcript_6337:180-992(+)
MKASGYDQYLCLVRLFAFIPFIAFLLTLAHRCIATVIACILFRVRISGLLRLRRIQRHRVQLLLGIIMQPTLVERVHNLHEHVSISSHKHFVFIHSAFLRQNTMHSLHIDGKFRFIRRHQMHRIRVFRDNLTTRLQLFVRIQSQHHAVRILQRRILFMQRPKELLERLRIMRNIQNTHNRRIALLVFLVLDLRRYVLLQPLPLKRTQHRTRNGSRRTSTRCGYLHCCCCTRRGIGCFAMIMRREEHFEELVQMHVNELHAAMRSDGERRR